MTRLFVKRWVVRVVSTLLVVALVVCLVVYLHRQGQIQHRMALLSQVYAALHAYVVDSRKNVYPPRGLDGVHPDWDLVGPYLGEDVERAELFKLWSTDADKPLCYLGHVVVDEEMAMDLLDRYDSAEASEARDANVENIRRGSFPSIVRFREGVERYFIHDIGNPAGSAYAQSVVPLFWELPPSQAPGVAYVVYMDGHVEEHAYPGTFPLTEPFVRRARATMGIVDPPPTEAMREMLFLDSPVIDVAREILAAEIRWSLPPALFVISHCDVTPSMHVDGHDGFRIVAGDCQVVLFPSSFSGGAEMAARIDWREPHGVPEYMGEGRGYHWYSDAAAIVQVEMRHVFALAGGDDLYSLYARAYRRGLNYGPQYHAYAGSPFERSSSEDIEQRLAKPASAGVYRLATLALRARRGSPVSDDAGDAAAILHCRLYGMYSWQQPPEELVEKAVDDLKRTEDVEAAALFALQLALVPTGRKIVADVDACNRIGSEILAALPREVTEPMLRHIASHVQDQAEAVGAQVLLERICGDGEGESEDEGAEEEGEEEGEN